MYISHHAGVKPILQTPESLTITFTISPRFGPATLAAVLDMSNQLGKELEGTHSNQKTQALTDAAIGFGALRAAMSLAVPKGPSAAYDQP